MLNDMFSLREGNWVEEFRLRGVPGYAEVMMPAQAEILRIDSHGDDIVMWAITDMTLVTARSFLVVETGEQVPKGLTRHVGTTRMGAKVLHVFSCALR